MKVTLFRDVGDGAWYVNYGSGSVQHLQKVKGVRGFDRADKAKESAAALISAPDAEWRDVSKAGTPFENMIFETEVGV